MSALSVTKIYSGPVSGTLADSELKESVSINDVDETGSSSLIVFGLRKLLTELLDPDLISLLFFEPIIVRLLINPLASFGVRLLVRLLSNSGEIGAD